MKMEHAFYMRQKMNLWRKTNMMDVMEILTNKGFNVEEMDISKNGLNKHGYRILTENNVSPVFYEDFFKRFDNEEDMFMAIKNYLNTIPKFNTDNIFDTGNIKKNLFIALQKTTNEDLIKKPFLDLEEYLYIVVSENAKIKLKPEHLKAIGLDENELWEIADQNTKENAIVNDMATILAEFGMEMPNTPDTPLMIILTNKNRLNGAITMKYTDILNEIATKHNLKKMMILPSSIHESIVTPYIEIGDINNIINNINNNEVVPEEILSNHYYIYDKNTNTLA